MTSSRPLESPTPVSPSQDRATPIPSIDDSLGLKLLPFVLSMVAGSLDITGFLGLGGLFTAHITGNLVLLAARLVAHQPSPMSHVIAVPVFMVVLVLTRLFVVGLERIAVPSLLPLLALQFLLLATALGSCIATGVRVDPNGLEITLAGMFAVSGMAVQNALVRVSLADAPSTAVMTTNVTVFAMDVGQICFGGSRSDHAKARIRAGRTWPAIAGFLIGCALGAVCEPAFGLMALAVPTLLSLGAIGFGLSGPQARPKREKT
ncbi:MAG TPA: YoaK family protein [Bradyrhizobium sp.]|nr:YoaK family protein [Bradyrhizobium sp.]